VPYLDDRRFLVTSDWLRYHIKTNWNKLYRCSEEPEVNVGPCDANLFLYDMSKITSSGHCPLLDRSSILSPQQYKTLRSLTTLSYHIWVHHPARLYGPFSGILFVHWWCTQIWWRFSLIIVKELWRSGAPSVFSYRWNPSTLLSNQGLHVALKKCKHQTSDYRINLAQSSHEGYLIFEYDAGGWSRTTFSSSKNSICYLGSFRGDIRRSASTCTD